MAALAGVTGADFLGQGAGYAFVYELLPRWFPKISEQAHEIGRRDRAATWPLHLPSLCRWKYNTHHLIPLHFD